MIVSGTTLFSNMIRIKCIKGKLILSLNKASITKDRKFYKILATIYAAPISSVNIIYTVNIELFILQTFNKIMKTNLMKSTTE